MASRRTLVVVAVACVLVAGLVEAAPGRRGDVTESVLKAMREHQRALEAAVPRRENDLRAAAASLERRSALYARGAITREELARAARDVSDARSQLDATRGELTRIAAFLVELEARRHLARLPLLRPGQYDVSGGVIRYAGTRALSAVDLRALETYFSGRAGRALPVSASGQSDLHTRLGLDHRHAIDVAVHPDSAEGRLVMAWLREHDIPFLAFAGARRGAATGAHIHVGAPSERLSTVASASSGGAARNNRQ